MDRLLSASALATLAQQAHNAAPCACLARDLSAWSAWPVGYREAQFSEVGTLCRYAAEDAIISEYHPGGTSYWSAEAPIAPRYYPYNQSTVWACVSCQRLYLRHNDDGAYHVAPRIRRVQPELIVDAPHAYDGREAPRAF
ncbi:hypothetical protein [Pseudomonas sp. NPDC007930]|uniref:hypothetical protein n=1 Tax=Pseudomonas sp. NPDC007930 TaxID=3364417 RepID=UPI0036E0BB33